MQFCFNCGYKLQGELNYCPSCGKNQNLHNNYESQPESPLVNQKEEPVFSDISDAAPIIKNEPEPNLSMQSDSQDITNPLPQTYEYIPENIKNTSIGGWLGWILLCMFLPVGGFVITICSSKDRSVKNWAIATLVLGMFFAALALCAFLFAGDTIVSYFNFVVEKLARLI